MGVSPSGEAEGNDCGEDRKRVSPDSLSASITSLKRGARRRRVLSARVEGEAAKKIRDDGKEEPPYRGKEGFNEVDSLSMRRSREKQGQGGRERGDDRDRSKNKHSTDEGR